MTTTFLLVRHAAHDDVGSFLTGRAEGISLGETGRAQAERLGRRLAEETFEAIHASPRERTQETAAAIAAASGIGPVSTESELDEVDFGSWTGKSFEELEADPLWGQWNRHRSLTRTPGGETMLDVQGRVLRVLERLALVYHDKAVVLVSHAEVIRAAVCHFLGIGTDAWSRIEVAPASVTRLAAGNWGGKLLSLNERLA